MNITGAVFHFQNKFRTAFNPFNLRLKQFTNKIQNIEPPDRLKGTFVERWGQYWKNLYIDYKEVVIDVGKESKSRPVRTLIYTLRTSVYLSRHNPDECSFREQLLCASTKVLMVSQPTRNPKTVQHIKWMEKCYNEGTLRYLNLGLISLIWLHNFNEDCALYKAACPYLKPRYQTLYHRIVDVGFLDKWCYLEDVMKDYDVNEAEFQQTDTNKTIQSSLTIAQ